MSRRELESKVAIVTGSVRGIGRATALAFADAGASVVVNGRKSAEAADEIAREVEEAGGKARVHLADVSDPDQARGLIEAAVSAFGRLDILVNNVSHRIAKPIVETGYEEWRDVQANTLDSAFLCIRAAVPHLIAAGGGSIVNIGGGVRPSRRQEPLRGCGREGGARRDERGARRRARAAQHQRQLRLARQHRQLRGRRAYARSFPGKSDPDGPDGDRPGNRRHGGGISAVPKDATSPARRSTSAARGTCPSPRSPGSAPALRGCGSPCRSTAGRTRRSFP